MLTAKTISLTRYIRAGQIAEYIRECCVTGNAGSVSIAMLSKRFALCETNIKTAFRQRYQTSICAYLCQQKHKHICSLLDHTDMSIKEIALKNGYNDLSNFSRDFSKCVGMSPTEYRRRMHASPAAMANARLVSDHFNRS